MASTYTTSLKIQEIGNGEQSGVWGTTTNTNWQLIEQAVAGVQTITMSNANYTLTNLNGVLDEARNMVLVIQGTNSGIYQVVAPLNQPKMYVISNQTSGGYAITIGASSGSVVTIPNGTTAQVYCDGSTGFYSAQTGSAGNFTVNGNFTVTGNQTDTGNLTVGGTFIASNTATFAVSPTAPTPTAGDNTTKIATTAFVTTAVGAAGLTGAIQMWPTASAPTGYLLCNGAAVSRTTYAALYSVVGTTFGVGDGSTTFNIPNYQDRMPVGAGGAYALAATGGSATTTLSTSNLPAHNHTATVTDPGHSHPPPSGYNFAGYGPPGNSSGPNNTFSAFSQTGTATTGISVSIANTGSGTAATTISPYLGIYFIIKT
jgi:microcystin-dependent protein